MCLWKRWNSNAEKGLYKRLAGRKISFDKTAASPYNIVGIAEVNALFMDVSQALKNPGQYYPFDTTVEIPPTVVLDDPVSFEDVRLWGELIDPLRRDENDM